MDRKYHPLQRPRPVPTDGADHQPRSVVERKAAHARAESHQRQRAATELVGFRRVAAVAAVMISPEVGPPSSIVAAWIT